MSKRKWPVAITAAIGLGLGLVLRFTGGGSPVGWSMVAILVVLPLFGVLITIDDDLPGGWSNPDGNVRAPWLYWENWAEIASRGAISGVGFAIDAGWYTAQALVFWIVGATGIAITIALHKRIDRQVARWSRPSCGEAAVDDRR